MKSWVIVVSTVFALNAGAAQFQGTCSQEILRCDVSRINANGKKEKIDTVIANFEPTKASECGLTLVGEDLVKPSNQVLIVEIGDRTRTADIYSRVGPRGEIGPDSALFPVEAGKTFYYTSGGLALKCILTNK